MLKYNRLTYIKDLPERSSDNHIISLWNCDCGTIKAVVKTRVIHGKIRSCGCLKDECKPGLTHGMKYTKEYRAWQGIKGRCESKTNKDYFRYGKKGICFHKPWSNDFVKFFKYIGYAPSPKHQIDRIDTRGNYEPGNIRWATASQQCRNRTNSYEWFIKGIHFPTMREAALFFKVADQTVHKWVNGHYDYRKNYFNKPRKDCFVKPRYERI